MKDDEIGRACSAYGRMRNAFKILVTKPEGKRPLGRPWFIWEDDVDWIHLA
jgi:hypothetical protein